MTDRIEMPLPDITANQAMLLRGGETLALDKVADRFTICPVAGAAVAEVLAPLASAMLLTSPILDNRLIEVCTLPQQVDALMQVARQSPQIAFASHIYQLRQSPGTLIYLTDQITLQFTEQMTPDRMQQLTTAAGLRILKLITGVPKAFVFQVASAAVNPLKLTAQLLQHPDVLLAEPNVAVLRQPCYRPRETDYGKQWYFHHEGGESLAAGSHIFAEAAWNLTRGRRSVTVAIVDDGVDLQDPDFQSEGKIIAPVNFQDAGALPLPAAGQHHGTAMARLAVADETGRGMLGMAPGCALMPIRIGDWIDDQVLEQVCQWAIDRGADVVCWGWHAAAVYFPLSLRQRVALTQAATQGREGRGCVLIFAAGNANRPIDGTIDEQGWPDSRLQGPTQWLNGFAVHPDVITVSACTSLNQKSASSNWGTGIAVTAPGGSAAPALLTQQTGWTATGPELAAPQAGRPIEWALDGSPLGGTSAASALVAGVAALVLSVNPDLTAREVRQILEQTADRIVDQNPDLQLQRSAGQYDARRYSTWFGYGKVNALKAVQLAQRLIVPMPLPDRWLEYCNPQQLAIPDGSPEGLISPIQVTEAGRILDLEVKVEVDHDFLGDLEIALIPPWGEAMVLQNRSLGRSTHLQTTFSLENAAGLRSALHQPVQGLWQLKLIDAIPAHRGVLQQWQLNLGI
jgi:subtilisin family serine protease/subtilisin-like proprotein convertase family protein